MANADSPFGLKPVSHISGASWNGVTWRCFIPSTDGTAMYVGDPVVLAGAADPSGLESIYRPVSTNRYCQVCIDPSVVYEIQGDSSAAIAATDVGSNIDMVYTHSGETITGLSGVEANASAIHTGAAYQLKLMG